LTERNLLLTVKTQEMPEHQSGLDQRLTEKEGTRALV